MTEERACEPRREDQKAQLTDDRTREPRSEDQKARPMSAMNYDAVLLAGFGGPEGPDDVMPFLRNVTRGRGIPEERLVEVSAHYRALGGVSPINAQSRALQLALQAELDRRGLEVPVLWGNRNWDPYLSDVVGQAAADGHRRLLGLATSAYSSYSSCRQYREDFAGALIATDLVGTVTIDKVHPYFDLPGFLEPFVEHTAAAVNRAKAEGFALEDIELLFTTHSVPNTMADASGSAQLGENGDGGAYVAQHLAMAAAVAAGIANHCEASPTWQLVYQSRSGPPSMPWLEPDICDVIATCGNRGIGAVVVVPIGFVSDHVEVIWDLDREAAEAAAEAELWFERVPTPGTDRRFVRGLADLLVARLTGAEPGPDPDRVIPLPVRPDPCAVNCCANSRVTRPTTAGADSAADWKTAGIDIDPERLVASGICGVEALR